MKKIRIGNDIVIKWRVTINGEEVNLEGLDLSLYISTTYQPRKAIAFTVAGNEITATYKGSEQKVTGVYRLTLYRNEGENAQSILDACDAFELVSCSCLTTDVAFGGAEVELPIADLGVGIPGLSAYEIACIEGFKGTQAEWIASLSAGATEAVEECRKFTEKAKISEKERQDNEALRIVFENERSANETTRQSAEADRLTAERSRTTAEQQRVTNETARSNAESSRAAAETARQSAEESRQEAEQGRVTAEQQRADAEAARARAEADRNAAEKNRATAELNRDFAESTRSTNESQRVSAENSRVAAETHRAAEFATYEGTINEIKQMVGGVESVLRTING